MERDGECQLGEGGIRMAGTPYQAPNANAYAERLVRSINEECLNRMIPIGERHFQCAYASSLSTTTESGIIKGCRMR
jgi:hypothetical protein